MAGVQVIRPSRTQTTHPSNYCVSAPPTDRPSLLLLLNPFRFCACPRESCTAVRFGKLIVASLPAQIWDFLPDTGPVHYYQEEILHAAVTGADSFFFFVRPKPLGPLTPAPAQSLAIARGRLMHIRIGRLDATTASHSASS